VKKIKEKKKVEPNEFFMNLLKENWANARHQESQRMWFANIFSAIFVGILAYVAQQGLSGIHWLLPSGLLAISVIGLLVTMKVNRVFDDYKQAIKKIFEDKRELLGFNANEKRDDYIGMFKADETCRWRIIRVRYLYIALYSIGIAASLYLIWLN